MRGHSHSASASTQNQGNVLGDRSSVRQSKFFRQYESGNTMKGLLGSSNLAWNVNEKEGAYKGQAIYDFNAQSLPSNEISMHRKQYSDYAKVESSPTDQKRPLALDVWKRGTNPPPSNGSVIGDRKYEVAQDFRGKYMEYIDSSTNDHGGDRRQRAFPSSQSYSDQSTAAYRQVEAKSRLDPWSGRVASKPIDSNSSSDVTLLAAIAGSHVPPPRENVSGHHSGPAYQLGAEHSRTYSFGGNHSFTTLSSSSQHPARGDSLVDAGRYSSVDVDQHEAYGRHRNSAQDRQSDGRNDQATFNIITHRRNDTLDHGEDLHIRQPRNESFVDDYIRHLPMREDTNYRTTAVNGDNSGHPGRLAVWKPRSRDS